MKRKSTTIRRLLLSLALAAVLGLAFGATAWADGEVATVTPEEGEAVGYTSFSEAVTALYCM